jgi:NTE family protein
VTLWGRRVDLGEKPLERVGLVLAGGGARGAYEAGVLSTLLPALEARGQRPTVILGTSVGALNAAFAAAQAHLPADEALGVGIERWESLEMDRVVRPILLQQAPKTALLYAGEVLGVPGARLRGLLDPSPLKETLAEWIDWKRLHRNVRDGTVEAVGVVATAITTERSVVFVEGRAAKDLPRSFSVDYVPTRLEIDHARASAAIPALFPGVRIDKPARFRGWYYDGGTRLNTPIKPVLDFGVDRVIVVAGMSIAQASGATEGPEPDFADGALELIQATLVDPLIADVRMLGKINLLVEDGDGKRADEWRRSRGKPPYRRVPYIFVGPRERDALGRLADRVYDESFSGLRQLRSPDVSLLSRLVGGEGRPHGELLSYLFFEGEFAREAIALGQADAQAWLDDHGEDPWQVGPLE